LPLATAATCAGLPHNGSFLNFPPLTQSEAMDGTSCPEATVEDLTDLNIRISEAVLQFLEADGNEQEDLEARGIERENWQPDDPCYTPHQGQGGQRSYSYPSVITGDIMESGRKPSKNFSTTTTSNSGTGVTTLVARLAAQELQFPEMLRAIHAAVALRGFGLMLRQKPVLGAGARAIRPVPLRATPTTMSAKDYQESFVANSIDHFWSHNWGAPVFQKVLVLLLHYNLLASAVAGTVAAGVGAILSATALLPYWWQEENGFQYAPWAILFGQATFWPVLLLWQPQQKVFLDKACISQIDCAGKKRGIESIGAILRLSRSLLVLWDPGYVKRLWCVFELAAYVKAHGQRLDGGLTIRPVLWGYMWIALYIGNGLVAFWYFLFALDAHIVPFMGGFLLYIAVSMHVMRSMQRLLTTLKKQLQAFSFSGAECFCCSVHHVDPVTGDQVLCDRRCVLGCIVAWFGSMYAFEDFVHSGLYPYFRRHLGQHGLPYLWVISTCLPYVWMSFDALASRLRGGESLMITLRAPLDAFATSTTVAPFLIGLSLLVAKLTQRQHPGIVVDLAVTLVASIMVAAACFFMMSFAIAIRALTSWWLALLLQVVTSSLLTAAIFCA